MKISNVLLLALIASISLFSCSSDDDDSIVGKWSFVSVKADVDCNSEELKQMIKERPGMIDPDEQITWIEFFENGTFKDSDEDTGRYTAKDGMLTLIYDHEEYEEDEVVTPVKYSVQGDKLNIIVDSTELYKYEYIGEEGWEGLEIKKVIITQIFNRQ